MQKESFVHENMRPYYNDLNEHLCQITDSLKAYKEMNNSLHEMHMSNVSNDMNKIMMTLTIFSAIFIPLSFLAGVFGMNFSYIPGLDIKSAFYVFITVCATTAGGMLLFFKLKKWY
ncbi:Mg2+ and Co2+ transporter CorA [Fusibacter tunisiensis]|uniref:Mg2+ and Co2+ transporter CorA n=2 Tax=Fusibacter tunisiensis TaxID=1008308 RepID=A0ABS2MUB1_9FIRM|nr:Mg2+ and Co2+ transporter CorA [Fusibacter tunisiensis]